MTELNPLLTETEVWCASEDWCTPVAFAEILARPDTEFALANRELLLGPRGGFLREIIQTLYYVSHETDEGRSLAFNVVYNALSETENEASPWGVESAFQNAFQYWCFQETLPFSVQELRRLAVCNPDTSAIWLDIPGDRRDPEHMQQASLNIRGLALLGQKWMDSVQSLSYEYANREIPLLFRVEGPGWIEVYLGSRFYARLKSGIAQVALPRKIKDKNVLNYLVKDGVRHLKTAIKSALPPLQKLSPGDALYFAEYSYYSVILGIINSIQRLKHGGALVLTSMGQKQSVLNHVKLKYAFQTQEHVLKGFYLEFITAMSHGLALRQSLVQEYGDVLGEPGTGLGRPVPLLPALSAVQQSELETFYYRVNQAQKSMVECCQMVGGFSSTDGAIVLDTSLDTLGFSGEILLETLDATLSNQAIYKFCGRGSMAEKTSVPIDLKHMGMRHRSAAKLCAAIENIAVFVVSQDGGVSLIWNKGGQVFFWEDFRTKNMPFDLLPTLFEAEREVFGERALQTFSEGH